MPGATHRIHGSIATRDVFAAAVRGFLAGLYRRSSEDGYAVRQNWAMLAAVS